MKMTCYLSGTSGTLSHEPPRYTYVFRTRALSDTSASLKVLDENGDSHITVPEVVSGFPSTCDFLPRLKYLARQFVRIKRTFLSL